MMNKKTCWNCLHEYQCDWSPAGEQDYCKNWTDEMSEREEKEGEE